MEKEAKDPKSSPKGDQALSLAKLQCDLGRAIGARRASLGYDLDHIEQETKISKHFLQKIEEGHFDSLPGKVFEKGFIKSLVRLLQLQDDPTVCDYLGANSTSESVRSAPKETWRTLLSVEHLKAHFHLKKQKKGWRPYTIATALLGAGVCVVGLLTFFSLSPTASKKNSVLFDKVMQNLPAKAPDQIAKLDSKEEQPNDLPPPAGGNQPVTVTVRKEVVLHVRDEGDYYRQDTFSPGVYRFAMKGDHIDFFFANAGAVEVKFGERSYGPAGLEGEAKHLSFYVAKSNSGSNKL